MQNITFGSHPMLLGFDKIDQILQRAAGQQNKEGTPPFNIEAFPNDCLRITIAAAGYGVHQLSVSVEGQQLKVQGSPPPGDSERQYLYRGISSGRFQHSFVLAEGMKVPGAKSENGLLLIDLSRPVSQPLVQSISIDTC